MILIKLIEIDKNEKGTIHLHLEIIIFRDSIRVATQNICVLFELNIFRNLVLMEKNIFEIPLLSFQCLHRSHQKTDK